MAIARKFIHIITTFLLLDISSEHRVVDTFGSKFFQLPGCSVDKARPALNTKQFRVDSDFDCARTCLWLFEDNCRWMNYIEPEKVAGENCELGTAPVTATCSDLVLRTGYHYHEKGDFCLNGSTLDKKTLQCTCNPGWTGQRCSHRAYDCSDHYYAHMWSLTSNLVLDIQPRDSASTFKVNCDLTKSYNQGRPGGYTCIQRQGWVMNGINFDRTWAEYRDGFGDLWWDFWAGNTKIHEITMKNSPRKYRLRVNLRGNSNNSVWAFYNDFKVNSEAEKYRVTLTPDSYNSLRWHGDAIMPGQADVDMTNNEFSTPDNDNDGNPTENCALGRKAGWWYGSGCTNANLNAPFYNKTAWNGLSWPQITWGTVTNISQGFRLVRMCLQPYDVELYDKILLIY
ncbi:fibroleukin-like [Lineus longissimus]|uniref:fibroleukin-like n=1 Tax=Lineus longissimus TaxID=88925 RepID=UPI00315DB55D